MEATKQNGVRYLTHEQARRLFDQRARELLGMSGEEFVQLYERGELDSRLEEPAVRRLEMLLPLGR